MKIYVMLADGFEEIEALSVVDVLRRGEADTVMVAVKNGRTVMGAHHIPVVADVLLTDIKVNREDMIVLPGGGVGVQNLAASEPLIGLLKEHQSYKGLLAAICAGPTIPGKLGFYKDIKAICYPGCEGDLLGAVISREDVVVHRNFITSRGPGTSLAFAYKLLEMVKGAETAKKVSSGMLYNKVP